MMNNEPVYIKDRTGTTARVSTKSGDGFTFSTDHVNVNVQSEEMSDSTYAALSAEFTSECKQRQKVSKIKQKVLFHGFCTRPQDVDDCSVKVPTDITSWLKYMRVFARNLTDAPVTNVNNVIDKSSVTMIERVKCKNHKDCESKCKKQGKAHCRGLASIVNDEMEKPFDSNNFGSVENIKNDLQKRVDQIKRTFKPKNIEQNMKDLRSKVKKSLIECNMAQLRLLYYKSLTKITQNEKDRIKEIETQQYDGQPVLSAQEIKTIKERIKRIDFTKRLDLQKVYRDRKDSACRDYKNAKRDLDRMENVMARRGEQFLKLQNKLDKVTLLKIQNLESGSNTRNVLQPQQALTLVRATDVLDETALRGMARSSANTAAAVFDWTSHCKKYKNQPTCDGVPQCIWEGTYCRKRVSGNDKMMTSKETERFRIILDNLKKILKDYPNALQNVSKILTTRRVKGDEHILQRAKTIKEDMLKTKPILIKNAIDRSAQRDSRLRQVLQNALANNFTAGFVFVTSCAKRQSVINENDNAQVAISQLSVNPLNRRRYESQINVIKRKLTQTKATLFELHSDKKEQQTAAGSSQIEEKIEEVKLQQAKLLGKLDFFEKKLKDNSLRVVNLVASAKKWKNRSKGREFYFCSTSALCTT